MAGSHGLERRSADGSVDPRADPARPCRAATDAASAFAARHGLLLEAKAAGVALHYRDAQHAEARRSTLSPGPSPPTPGSTLQSGKCVRELRVPGADKGDAVRAFMAEPPFALGRPVVVGDDLTDEHAFAAAAALGGSAILVGEPRPTAARLSPADGRGDARLAGGAAMKKSLTLWPIGNCQVSALVDEAAGMVWACQPQVDGDPLFCSLLDPKREAAPGLPAGEWRIIAQGPGQRRGRATCPTPPSSRPS